MKHRPARRFVSMFANVDAASRKMQKEVFEITDGIGKEKDYLLILERKTAGVVYHPAQINITDEIIKRYNLKVSKTN